MGVLRVFEPIVGKSKGRPMNTDGGPMGLSMGVMELRMVALWWGPIHLRRRGWRWRWMAIQVVHPVHPKERRGRSKVWRHGERRAQREWHWRRSVNTRRRAKKRRWGWRTLVMLLLLLGSCESGWWRYLAVILGRRLLWLLLMVMMIPTSRRAMLFYKRRAPRKNRACGLLVGTLPKSGDGRVIKCW